MRNCPTFATSFAAFSEARPDLTQLAGKLLMKMDNSSYVSIPSRPYARSQVRGADAPGRLDPVAAREAGAAVSSAWHDPGTRRCSAARPGPSASIPGARV